MIITLFADYLSDYNHRAAECLCYF